MEINTIETVPDYSDTTNLPVAVNIAPAPDFNQQAALLSPKPVTPVVNPININVWIKDTEQPQQVSECDTLDFVINFTVSVYDEATNTSKTMVVPKRIQASKRKLLCDAENFGAQIPVTVVETVKQNKKSDAQRVRELAGIPHSKNHV